jgi:hypothetical protein
VHLQDKFIVRQFRQDNFVVVGHADAPSRVSSSMGPKPARHFSFSDMPRMKADSKGGCGKRIVKDFGCLAFALLRPRHLGMRDLRQVWQKPPAKFLFCSKMLR